MAVTIIDPVARIEGHLKAEITVTGGVVTDAKMTGNMYRGFENFLVGLEPLDAPLITQRVCGVCPTNHAMAAVYAMDDAAKVQATPKGRLMRNLIDGAEFLHSHVLHLYHLAAQDYIDASSLGSPWAPLYGGDRRISLSGKELSILPSSPSVTPTEIGINGSPPWCWKRDITRPLRRETDGTRVIFLHMN